jgi:uncharacterized membrane protein YphA (DoxX/SURF4 family)
MRPTGLGTGFPPVDRGRTVTGPGFAVTVGTVVTALFGAVLFAGALVVIAAVFLLVTLVAAGVVAIRAAGHALIPRSGARRVEPGGFRPAAVIETTATVIRNTGSKLRR